MAGISGHLVDDMIPSLALFLDKHAPVTHVRVGMVYRQEIFLNTFPCLILSK